MSRKIYHASFWLQTGVVVAVLLLPIMFTAPNESISLTTYLRRSVMPAMMVLMFYINYLWLAPKYLMQKTGRKKFWLFNILFVLLFALGLSAWNNYNHRLYQRKIPEWAMRGPRKIPRKFIYFGILRDVYNLSVVIALASSIRLSKQWADAEKANKEAEVMLRESELLNLRNQVNPHFLLNTLNNIYALIAFDQPKAQQAVMELGKMMRHVLGDNKELVNMSQEVDFIHNYVDLMKLRLTSNVEVTEHYDIPSPCSVMIAPMLLISLVENAFKHGISPMKKSFVHIDIQATPQQITCSISNSHFPKKENDQSGHGVGLQQVGRRLELLYPGQYEWEKGVSEDKQTYTSKITLYDTKLHHH